MKTAKENKQNEIKGTQVQQQHIMVRLAVTLQRCLTSAVALGDASGKSGVRARERQVRGGAFRWERQVSDEGRCARRVGGRCGDRAHPRYGAGGGFARLRRAVPGGDHGHRLIWVPAKAESLKTRLLVCAHLEGAGHRGVDATMARLERHNVWEGMAGDVRDMTRLLPVLCGHQGRGASAPYAGRDPSRARAKRSCAFGFSLHGGERGGCRALTLRMDFSTAGHSRGREWIHMAATV